MKAREAGSFLGESRCLVGEQQGQQDSGALRSNHLLQIQSGCFTKERWSPVAREGVVKELGTPRMSRVLQGLWAWVDGPQKQQLSKAWEGGRIGWPLGGLEAPSSHWRSTERDK